MWSVYHALWILLLPGGSRQHPPAGAGDEEQPGPAWGARCPACPYHGQPELSAGLTFGSVVNSLFLMNLRLRCFMHYYVFSHRPQPGSKMVASAKSAVPTVADQAAAMQLGQCAKNLATCLAELRTATQKVFSPHCCFIFSQSRICTKCLLWGHTLGNLFLLCIMVDLGLTSL